MNRSNTLEQMDFFRALSAGDANAVRSKAIANPGLLDAYDYRSFGATPLTMACFSGRRELVELLIELGADPNRRSDWQMGPWSPLHCVIYRRDKGLARYLLDHGAEMDVHTAAGLGDCDTVARLLELDPSRVNERGGDGCQPLHFADTVEVAKLLLERGALIDGRCTDHFSTPVQYLCTVRSDVARFLLSSGATPDIFSSVTCGDIKGAEHLLRSDPELLHARINQTFFPPGHEHDVHNIMTFTIGSDSTPLHAAARANQPEAVYLLVRNGLPVDVRGGYDHGTALHIAAWNRCVDAAEALLASGADIEARSGKLHNNTPAGWAIVAGADAVFELLIERGAHCHPWFLDDATDGCNGLFNQVSNVPMANRERILARLRAADTH